MSDRLHLRSGKRKYLFGLMLLSFVSIVCVAFSMKRNDDFDVARREVLLRKIGHELLLQSGDSTSRVLPVKTIGAHEYRISFEHAFTFYPDSLVNITQRLLAKDPLAGDYVVNILNCGNATVAYGFAISASKKDDIVACQGRKQPTACYMVDIKFKPANVNIVKKVSFWGSLSVLAFAGVIFLRSARPRRVPPASQQIGVFNLGSISFDAEARKLMINGNTIDLTATETRVLHIFALSPNETIERSRLQKEIWEDEGVIVGRSLDMFISKLRKKLEPAPDINIVVVRGKGYKLEISA
ncbi:winged helix-turn-helix domain-containing protein [Chitinophaga nivalis]|uniref:Winged helix-turn-helix domain-containing protein n=1 Tax=Chitinophaga nivalis TaxID=2991709 RepID=A0ABT3IHA1_9BACT|nr:winged helix-turn-helix domain-containing protein [Chitinophaga nivalis]MCW3466962.1 winged helix-turn-helix domain-containing protein [Chitinophaga nivalis]MCW3483347.1 winged helix-turn-helix domain-containing protein [Chitinophaga nivalis]